MSKQSAMEKISSSQQLESKEEVQRFWVKSTNDFYENKKTGIDISQRQDTYWKFLDLWEREIVLENLSKGLVLDLGAGTGRLTKFLKTKGRQVLAVDFVYDCLTAVEPKSPKPFCAAMDVTCIALKDASIDNVVACRVLQSLPTAEQKETAVKAIARIMKPGGSLVLTEGNPLRIKLVAVPYNYYLSLADWKKILTRNGFTIKSVHSVPFLTLAKVLNKVSFGLTDHFVFMFKAANFLDRVLGQSLLKHVALQYDIIAERN